MMKTAEILKVDVVTLGVFENNDRAHSCYKKAGFVDKETVERDYCNVIEMEIDKAGYEERKVLLAK